MLVALLLVACWSEPSVPPAATPAAVAPPAAAQPAPVAPPAAVAPAAPPPAPTTPPATLTREEPPTAPPSIASADAIEIPDACPFECCSYSDRWKTTAALALFDKPDGAKTGEIAAGTAVVGVKGVMRGKAGQARAKKPVGLWGKDPSKPEKTLPPGTSFTLLDRVGEGAVRVSYEGKTWQVDADACLDGAYTDASSCTAEVVTPAALVWWAQVRLKDGREGWLRMDKGGIMEGMDGC